MSLQLHELQIQHKWILLISESLAYWREGEGSCPNTPTSSKKRFNPHVCTLHCYKHCKISSLEHTNHRPRVYTRPHSSSKKVLDRTLTMNLGSNNNINFTPSVSPMRFYPVIDPISNFPVLTLSLTHPNLTLSLFLYSYLKSTCSVSWTRKWHHNSGRPQQSEFLIFFIRDSGCSIPLVWYLETSNYILIIILYKY